MKKFITSSISDTGVTHVYIEVEIEYYGPVPVAASEYRGFYVPDGPLISGLPNAVVDSQALVDYEDFIESVQDLITEYYELHIYYKNESKGLSHYFGILAKDVDGTIILDFDFNLRVSNHDPHRSTSSQKHKKERDIELKRLSEGKKPRPLTKSITVNSEEFENYMDAYLKVDSIIEHAVEIITRRKK